jgi:SulP family sulfate permease
VFSGLLGGAPSSLSLSASLGMRSLGAAGPVAGFVAALVCLGAVVSGPCLLPFVPLFIPLGLLLSTALVMPVSWLLRDARNPLSSDADTHLAWVTCLGTVLLGPVLGVLGCIGLGLANSLWRAVSDGGVRFLQKGDVFHSNVDRSPAERRVLREQGASILVLRLRGYLFLGTLYGLTRIIRQNTGLRYVLLDFGAVTGLGASAVQGFQRLTHLARELGLVLFFTNLPLELEGHMESLGYSMDETGDCRIAVNLDYALEWCEDSILRDAGVLEERNDSLEEMLAATFPEPRLIPVLMKCLERVEVPKKKPVVSQGEASDAMYFLQAGKVHVELALPGGKLLRLKKMGPGTVFGEMGLYTSAPRSATVLATEKCVVYKLSVERFRLIQAKAPQLAAAVNRYIVTLLAERVAEENAKTRASQL